MKKTILITGASRGIGAATAIKAANLGYAVCINYISNKDAAESVKDKIISNGGIAKIFKADVGNEPEVKKLFEFVDKDFGSLSALVNNAGILETQMRVDQMNAVRIDKILKTNVTGYLLCAKEAILRMSTKYNGHGGAIVNVSSLASKHGSANEYVDYAASKGAVDVLTMGLAKEVAAEGIRINAVRPGYIYTDIHSSGGEPDRINRVKESVPMKRGGHVNEVANAILWLLSDEASFTTGTFIDVAGGR